MVDVTMTVNGMCVRASVAANMLLVTFLRDHLSLTGTRQACTTSQCGACLVHVDGLSVKACTMLAVQADGTAVTTIEGIGRKGALHPMQTAFRDHHGLQCGYCTAGMIMAALDLVRREPQPDEDDVRAWLKGNLCRCTGYHGIIKAVLAGAQAMRQSGGHEA